jgi:hypothetical protein
MNPIKWLRHRLGTIIQTRRDVPYDVLSREEVDAAMQNPYIRGKLVQFSLDEYSRNPYYKAVITKLANHVVGPTPTIIGLAENEEENNILEESHRAWCVANGIGNSYRNLRTMAALTGIGLMLKHKKENFGIFPIQTAYKVFGADSLRTPYNATPEDRIVAGIEYDKDWNIVKFHFIKDDLKNDPYLYQYETSEYSVKDVIYWAQGYETGRLNPVPECAQAFTIYPYIRRLLEAAVQGEEFRTSFPMAVELDATIYGPSAERDNAPKGILKYKPNLIPTLPVGSKLVGVPGSGSSSADKDKMLRTMASAAALCVEMPANLAIADSSNSNMASAQVDIQPWKNKCEIDRFDMEPCFRRSFIDFWTAATLVSDLVPRRARARYPNFYPHMYLYNGLFQHPDPLKNATARQVDLISGTKTLNAIYAEMGLNPKRQLLAEAKLLGITYDELIKIILTSRSKDTLDVLGVLNATE